MTGLIYVAIIALWAAVLVPMWMRRHDHASESRNVERFNHAMRTLAHPRRRTRPSEREVLQPRRESRPEVVVTGARRKVDTRGRLSASERRAAMGLDGADRRPSPRAARRRRSLLVLTALLVLAAGAVVAGLVPWPVLALPSVLILVFLLAGGERRSSAQSAPQRRPVRPSHRDIDLRPRAGSRAVPPVPRSAEGLAATGTDDAWADGWEPVPTTLPTYVNAPRASGIPRMLDLTTPGSWTSAAMLEHAQRIRANELYDQQQEALAEDLDRAVADYADPGRVPRRRAVND